MFNQAIAGHVPPVRISTDHARSAVSLPSMARELANPGGRGDQIGTVCTDVAPFRRATDWDHPARIPGSHVFLEFGGSPPEAQKLRRLLQRRSRPPIPQRHHASESCRESFIIGGKRGSICLGKPLQWTFRNSRRRLIENSHPTRWNTFHSGHH